MTGEAVARGAALDPTASVVETTDNRDRDLRRAESAVARYTELVDLLEAAPGKIEAKHARREKQIGGKAAELRDAKRDLTQAKRDLKAAKEHLARLEG